MPNWCEGVLKVRGEKKNLRKFVLNGLKPISYDGEELEPLKESEYETVEFEGDVWIEGTHRGFATHLDIWFEQLEEENLDSVIFFETKFAWNVDIKGLSKISEKYNIDFKIYAFESGGQFNRDVEILDGKVIKDATITFNNYEWECISPTLGG